MVIYSLVYVQNLQVKLTKLSETVVTESLQLQKYCDFENNKYVFKNLSRVLSILEKQIYNLEVH